MAGSYPFESPNHQSQCHGIEDWHSGILTLPVETFGRQTEAEFFRKPLGDEFGNSVFCPAVIAKKDPSYLLS